MSVENPSVWDEVNRRISLLDVARALGFELRKGLQKSPFREDKKKSFSVFSGKDGGLGFKDHADDSIKGGSWQFIELAKPDWEKKQIAQFLFELSGVDPKPTEFSKSKTAEMRRSVRKAAFESHARELVKVQEFARPEPWSASVSKRWNDGFQWLEKNAKRVAASRGWPSSVVLDLIDAELMSGASLPWIDKEAMRQPNTRRRQHCGVSFRVDMPKPVSGRAGRLELIPVGYHQRYVTFQGSERGKSWVFVPYIPAAPKHPTTFQVGLAEAKQTIPPLPFVLGNLDNPKLIVILEGQWDAITFVHACGYRLDSLDIPFAVFGLRGVNGAEVFLSFYSDWLRRVAPATWLIGDNDTAGRRWAERKNSEKIHETPSFIDRLKAMGASRVVYRTIAEEYGKDFNDFYQAAAPGPDYMQRWMKQLNLVH